MDVASLRAEGNAVAFDCFVLGSSNRSKLFRMIVAELKLRTVSGEAICTLRKARNGW